MNFPCLSRTSTTAKLALLLLGVLPSTGCSDDEPDNPDGSGGSTASSSSTSSDSGGSGGDSSSSSSSSSGGGGSGGGGDCLDASAYQDHLAFVDPSLCVVAVYEADHNPFGWYTWGSHGGPVTVDRGVADPGVAEITRLSPPEARTGKLTATKTAVAADVPSGEGSEYVFLGPVIDLPFLGWTVFSYGDFAAPPFPSQVVVVAGAEVKEQHSTTGYFEGVGIASGPDEGRFLHTGTSGLGELSDAGAGLYAADTCSTDPMHPTLVPLGDSPCQDPIQVDAWNIIPTTMALDSQGNVFAVSGKLSGSFEVRAFPADAVDRGSPPAAGTTLLEVQGAGNAGMAALAPSSGEGWLFFRPTDAEFALLDLQAVRYKAEAGNIVTTGAAEAMVKYADPAAGGAIMRDDVDRLWLSIPVGETGVAFVVLAPK